MFILLILLHLWLESSCLCWVSASDFFLSHGSDSTTKAKLKCKNKVLYGRQTDCCACICFSDVCSVCFREIKFELYSYFFQWQLQDVGDTWMSNSVYRHTVCSHASSSQLWIISGGQTEPINHPPDTFEKCIWMFQIWGKNVKLN